MNDGKWELGSASLPSDISPEDRAHIEQLLERAQSDEDSEDEAVLGMRRQLALIEHQCQLERSGVEPETAAIIALRESPTA